MALKFIIEDETPMKAIRGVIGTLVLMVAFAYFGYLATNGWHFLEHTYGFV